MSLINLKKLKTLVGSGIGGGGGTPVPPNFIPWNADTNTPTLTSGMAGVAGAIYVVSVAGTTNLDGITDWEVKDWAIFDENAGVWIKVDNTEPVPVPPTFGEMFFQGNSTETVITTINTPVKIAGSYVAGELQQMTHNAGVLTHTGNADTLIVIATTTESYNAVNASTTMKISKDGVALATSGQEIDLEGVTPSFNKNTVMKLVSVVNGSTISVFTENNGGAGATGTENITHQDLHVLVFSMGAGSSATVNTNRFAQTSTVMVDNTITETSIVGSGQGSLSFAANELKKGDSFTLTCSGMIAHGTDPKTFILRLRGGASLMLDTSAFPLILDIGGFRSYVFNIYFTVKEIGAAGVARVDSVLDMPYILFGTTQNAVTYSNTTTFDTTLAQTIDCTIQFQTADVSNVIHSETLVLSR